MACIFCEFMTSIEFDLDLHLYEEHRMELVKLPIGKGRMDTRIEYAIQEGKRFGNILKDLDQQTREKLGFYDNDDIDNSDVVLASQVKIGIDFILSHLAEPLFPRRIMTQELGVQINVFDKESILNQFQISDYNDCRINAYSYLSEVDILSSLYPRDEIRPVITI